ncbi:MAG: hypothetical protein GY861_18595 [bacterium]|nr:hypothetical protein [bacterium]
MTNCNLCEKKMKGSDSCIKADIEFPDGTSLPQSTDHFDEPDGYCGDCGVKHGGFHHPQCDVERCPRCKGQLISCGCLDEEDVEVEDGMITIKEGDKIEVFVSLEEAKKYHKRLLKLIDQIQRGITILSKQK